MTTTIPARPTTYKGIAMRSRLEARYAAWLDDVGADWTYEPQCFADQNGQYLPDFGVAGVLVDGTPRQIYVEVKPVSGEDAARAAMRMLIIWSSEPAAVLVMEVFDRPNPHAHWRRDPNDPNSQVIGYSGWRRFGDGSLCLELLANSTMFDAVTRPDDTEGGQ